LISNKNAKTYICFILFVFNSLIYMKNLYGYIFKIRSDEFYKIIF